jgi:protein-export membrane protein SecD/preprotein translocase SecF subunit
MSGSFDNVRKRLFIVIAVVLACLWAIFPPREKIKLGLDLDGGVHLVLRVKTDQALELHTQMSAERLRTALTGAHVAFSGVEVTGPGEFRVDGLHDLAAFRRIASDTESAFDRSERDGAQVFTLKASAARNLADETVDQARHTIERRVNELGVSEAVVARYTVHDQILVELPGVADVDRAKQIIKSTAQLRLTLVERGPFPDRGAALQSYENALPSSLEVLPVTTSADAAAGTTAFYVVHKTPAVAGTDLRDARQSLDEYNRPAVHFTLKQDAATRFGAFTAANIGRGLATVLDDRVTSVANIESRIDSQGQITGLSREEMTEQVVTFRSGALPADLDYVGEHMIGASLGEASIRSGVVASVAGLVLVMLFMLGYYRLAGLNAVISIVLNLLILIALVALIPVALTLPGIAGLILTIGMGVDSNVLIFERIKEELANAKDTRNVRAAVTAGFNRVWITIVDTHVTSLIAAAFLFQFGTTSIRGFATTLTIGLIANVFTAVFASKVFFDLMLRRRQRPGGRNAPSTSWLFRPSTRISRITTPRFDVTRWGATALLVSLLIIGAGLYSMATRGLPLGIDFSGGTLVVAEFARPGVTEEQVRAAVASLPGDEVVQRYGAASERRFMIRLPLMDEATTEQPGAVLEASVRQVTQALSAAPLPEAKIVERELVSAAIGADLQRRGIYATVASIVAITAYIAMRFRPSFAIGGIAATFHDVFVTLSCLSLAGYDLSLNVTAALLTVIGYSVNDTIVIFDRVRENAKAMRGQSLASLVNLSVHQTLSRTVITAGTTLLAVLALYLFGGDALRGFAFTMLVGIISGTWSTIFIASAIATRLSPPEVRRAPIRQPLAS